MRPSQTSDDPTLPTAAVPTDDKVNWMAEVRSVALLLLGVLAIHSFLAKPFYIPSESMMPNLLVGDRLVVSKFPYGWSYTAPSFHLAPEMPGRFMGRMPERGDIVILEPSGQRDDWIKRVVGLPGDRIEMRDGTLIINNKPVKQEIQPNLMLPVDTNAQCRPELFPGRLTTGADGKSYCDLPIIRETLPNGVSYDTIDLGPRATDEYGPIVVPDKHVFVMGDNRDGSADSRVAYREDGHGGLGGPIPWENLGGRAEFITFSMNGDTQWWNPVSWFADMRPGRTGISLRGHPRADAKGAR